MTVVLPLTRALLVALTGALAACRGGGAMPTPALGSVSSPRDTADVLEAVWRLPVSRFTSDGHRWLYLPTTDSVAFGFSDGVRNDLVQRGVPASTRRPVGHDTVVVEIRRWSRDSTGDIVLEVISRWTHMSTRVKGICMSGGNTEQFRVHRADTGWHAANHGGVHGNGYCRSDQR